MLTDRSFSLSNFSLQDKQDLKTSLTQEDNKRSALNNKLFTILVNEETTNYNKVPFTQEEVLQLKSLLNHIGRTDLSSKLLNNSLIMIYYKILWQNTLTNLETNTLINDYPELSFYELSLRLYNETTEYKDKYGLNKAIEVNLLLFYINKELFNSKKQTLYHQRLLQKLLEKRASSTTNPYNEQNKAIATMLKATTSPTPNKCALLIHNQFDQANWWRLALLRFKRNIDSINTFIQSSNSFNAITQVIDSTSLIFRFLAWIFYLPRLIYNLGIVLKHTFFYHHQPEEEKKLSVNKRFSIQFKKRWYAISNDLVWCSIGVLTCFLFTTIASAAPLLIALYAFDAINIILKNKLLQQNNPAKIFYIRRKEEHPSIKNIQKTQHYLLNHQKKEASLAIGTAFGLLIGTILSYSPQMLASSAIAASALSGPLMPIIGTGLILVIIGCQFFAKRHLEKQKKKDLQQELITIPNTPTNSITSDQKIKSHVPKVFHLIIRLFNTKKTVPDVPSNNSSIESLEEKDVTEQTTIPIPIPRPTFMRAQNSCATSCSYAIPAPIPTTH